MISPSVHTRTIAASAGIDRATIRDANDRPIRREPRAIIRVRDRRPVHEVMGSSSRTTITPFRACSPP
jgi:hypothetical protein